MSQIIANIVCNNLNEIIRDNIHLINELILDRSQPPNFLFISNIIRNEFPSGLTLENILVSVNEDEVILNYGFNIIKRLNINEIHIDINDIQINVNDNRNNIDDLYE